jgi:hypothetical protein
MLITNSDLSGFDSVTVPESGSPTLDVDEALDDGPFIQFFEQCFEWDQMTYVFYPYFWGSQGRWADNSQREDDDLTFQSFLRAGAARVLVPVTPNYEKSLLYYQQTGEVWNGGDVPTLDSDLYISVAEELLDSYDIPLDDAVPYSDDVWEAIVPTTLVKLQEDSTLPSWEAA